GGGCLDGGDLRGIQLGGGESPVRAAGGAPRSLLFPHLSGAASGPVSKSDVSLCQDRGMLRLTDFIIDCPNTMKLAAFYSEVTGRPIKEGSHENWAGIKFGEVELAFI